MPPCLQAFVLVDRSYRCLRSLRTLSFLSLSSSLSSCLSSFLSSNLPSCLFTSRLVLQACSPGLVPARVLRVLRSLSYHYLQACPSSRHVLQAYSPGLVPASPARVLRINGSCEFIVRFIEVFVIGRTYFAWRFIQGSRRYLHGRRWPWMIPTANPGS